MKSVRIPSYSGPRGKNADQNNSEYGHFLLSVTQSWFVSNKVILQFYILVFLEVQEENFRGTVKVYMIIFLWQLFLFCLKLGNGGETFYRYIM